jgi:AcrR family transcriptional regulator
LLLIYDERTFTHVVLAMASKLIKGVATRLLLLGQRREQIVLAALNCFVEHGFHQTSMRDLAAAAGVSLGNLYNHFENKQALIAEIAALEAAELQPLIDALPRAAPGRALQRFARDYLQLARAPDNARLSAEILAELSRQPGLAAPLGATRARVVEALCQTLARGVASAEFAAGLPEQCLAEMMLDALEGLALRELILPAQTPKSSERELMGLLARLVRVS